MSPANHAQPAFMASLDGWPQKAFEEFYAYAMEFLASRPPREFRYFAPEDREDLVHDLIVHCCQHDFRVLRTYDPGRVPFNAWFHYVARNRALDAHAKKSRRGDRETLAKVLPEPGADDSEQPALELRQLIQSVEKQLASLGAKCRTLLLGAAEGLAPRQLAATLGLPAQQGKKVSDDLRYCRRRLLEALRVDGFELSEYGIRKGSQR